MKELHKDKRNWNHGKNRHNVKEKQRKYGDFKNIRVLENGDVSIMANGCRKSQETKAELKQSKARIKEPLAKGTMQSVLRKGRWIMRNTSGEGYIDVVVMVLVVMMCLALCIRVLPVFITKIQLDNFADELIREAEISGRVGTETNARYARLSEKLGITPTVTWSQTGRIQLNQEVTVTLTLNRDIGLFGKFGSFPVVLRSKASGKSEVYWK